MGIRHGPVCLSGCWTRRHCVEMDRPNAINAVWYVLYFSLSKGWVFGVKLSDEDITEIERLRVVAMATNFVTNIAISWLCVWWAIATRQLVMEGGLSGRPTECRYCLRDVAMATTFRLSTGCNFGCIIASDTLFDSRGGFSGSSYPLKI